MLKGLIITTYGVMLIKVLFLAMKTVKYIQSIMLKLFTLYLLSLNYRRE